MIGANQHTSAHGSETRPSRAPSLRKTPADQDQRAAAFGVLVGMAAGSTFFARACENAGQSGRTVCEVRAAGDVDESPLLLREAAGAFSMRGAA